MLAPSSWLPACCCRPRERESRYVLYIPHWDLRLPNRALCSAADAFRCSQSNFFENELPGNNLGSSLLALSSPTHYFITGHCQARFRRAQGRGCISVELLVLWVCIHSFSCRLRSLIVSCRTWMAKLAFFECCHPGESFHSYLPAYARLLRSE